MPLNRTKIDDFIQLQFCEEIKRSKSVNQAPTAIYYMKGGESVDNGNKMFSNFFFNRIICKCLNLSFELPYFRKMEVVLPLEDDEQ